MGEKSKDTRGAEVLCVRFRAKNCRFNEKKNGGAKRSFLSARQQGIICMLD
jgi:hypothetical protein